MRSIRTTLERVGMGDGVDLLFIDEPRLVGIEDLLKPKKVAYRATDDYAAIKGDSSIKDAERIVCGVADRVFATSIPVAEQLHALSGKSVTTIENGVDLRHLRGATAEHSSLAGIPRPRVVYVGAIDFRFDMELVEYLALSHPDLAFINYGPATIAKPDSLPPNLHFPGPLPYRDLPNVLQHCDVGFLPMNDHAANRGRSPMKYYEYIAAGLPVLTRRTPEINRRSPEFAYESSKEASQVLLHFLSQTKQVLPSIDEQGWEQKAKLLISQLIESDGSARPMPEVTESDIEPLGVGSSCPR